MATEYQSQTSSLISEDTNASAGKNSVTNYLNDGCGVNEQDDNGNTPLHRAISSDAPINVLRNLLQKGASLTATNNPLECLNRCSWRTAINLLTLEKEFDYSSFLHRLMDWVGDGIWGIRWPDESEGNLSNSEQEELNGQFWKVIVNEIEQFGIDPNAQDKLGNTPLHVAAYFRPSSQHLLMLLSNFPNIDPLMVDCDGNTFLHVYCARRSLHIGSEFDKRLLQGDLKACPRTVLKQLLNCQNKQKDTPIHTLVQIFYKSSMSVYEFRCFSAAGADFNIPNIIGNTVLHCLIQLDEHLDLCGEAIAISKEEENDRDDCIEFLVRNGADVSKRNKLGEPPLFLADKVNTISVLLDNGANVNERNGLNQTPLISYMCRPDAKINIINLYLERGADINARDRYGSSALHYAAWHGVGQDIVRSLMDHGAKLQPDSLNHLPCYVAYWRGSKRIFDNICMCKDGLHKEREHFKFNRIVVEHSELENSSSEVLERASQHFDVFRGRNIGHVQQLPGFGLIRFDEEAEAVDVKSTVTECIRRVCEEVAKEDKWLSCTLIQSGSVSEMTKVGVPDEFDFLCIFEKINEVCYIDEQKSSTDPGFVYLKLKPEYSNIDCGDLFDRFGYLDTFQVRSNFRNILESLLEDFTIFCNPNLTYLKNHFKGFNTPTFQIALQWIGPFYKNLVIDIDIVPVCQVKGFWPENANLNSLECDVQESIDEGSILILQTKFSFDDEEPISKLRISALRAEKRHMQSLPSIAKEAYVVSKILYNSRLCPTMHAVCDVEAKDVISSYMLKTCMFHVHQASVSNTDDSVNYISKSDEDRYNDALYKYVLRIYQTFLKCAEDEFLPSFIFPSQNVFTFALFDFEVLENPCLCVYRRAFAKMILNNLGENNHFRDIDTNVCLDYNKLGYPSSDDSYMDKTAGIFFGLKRLYLFLAKHMG